MAKRKQTSKPAEKDAAMPTVTASGIDLGAVRELARIAGEFGLTEVEAEPSGRIRVSRRSGAAAAADPAPGPHLEPRPLAIALAPPAPIDAGPDAGMIISSPFVGTFYRSPSPESPVFVEVGQSVKKGQVVCIVEAMKLMNEIEAESDGKIAEVLVKNGEHVEYGQALFRLAAV